MNIKKLKDVLSISFQIQLLIERITLLPLNYTRYMQIMIPTLSFVKGSHSRRRLIPPYQIKGRKFMTVSSWYFYFNHGPLLQGFDSLSLVCKIHLFLPCQQHMNQMYAVRLGKKISTYISIYTYIMYINIQIYYVHYAVDS